MSVVVVSARVNSGDLDELVRVKGVVVFPRPSKNETTLWKLEGKSTHSNVVGVTLSPSLGKEHVAVAVQGVVECLFDEKHNKNCTPHIGTLLVPNNKGRLQCASKTSSMQDVVATYLQHTTSGRALVFLQRVDETPTSSSPVKASKATSGTPAATPSAKKPEKKSGLVGGASRASSIETVPPPLARDTPHPVVIKRVPPRAVASMAQRVKRGATLGDTPQPKKSRSRASVAPQGTRK